MGWRRLRLRTTVSETNAGSASVRGTACTMTHFSAGNGVEIQKNIVTNLQKGESITDSHDPSTDEVTGRITLEEGEQVTYRLDLKLLGQNPEKVGGSSLRDFLPLAEAGYWNDKTVQICYVPKGETALNISDKTETGWEIVADPKNPNQQIIEWSDDFTPVL